MSDLNIFKCLVAVECNLKMLNIVITKMQLQILNNFGFEVMLGNDVYNKMKIDIDICSASSIVYRSINNQPLYLRSLICSTTLLLLLTNNNCGTNMLL